MGPSFEEKSMIVVGKEESKKNFNSLIRGFEEKLAKDSSLKEVAPDYFVVGGDGSLNYFLNNYLNDESNIDEARVFYLPDGTANDFSRSLGLDSSKIQNLEVEDLCDIFFSEKTLECPVMTCNDQLFINTVTIGAPAKVTDSGRSNLKEKLGQWSYYISAIESFFEHQTHHYKVISDSEKSEEASEESIVGPGLIVGQGLYAGGGVKVTDNLGPLFGPYYYATIAKSKNISEIIKSIIKMQIGRLSKEDCVDSLKFNERLKLKFNSMVTVKIDGEPFEYETIYFDKTKKKVSFFIY